MKEMLSNLTVLETLELLAKTKLLSRFLTKPSLLQDIIFSIPFLHTRTYSVASSLSLKPTLSSTSNNNTFGIMLKRIPNGRFSSTFLTDRTTFPANFQYRIVDSVSGPRLRHLSSQTTKPLLIVATGAGFAPVRRRFRTSKMLVTESHRCCPLRCICMCNPSILRKDISLPRLSSHRYSPR